MGTVMAAPPGVDMDIQFRHFTPEHKSDFVHINRQWLDKLFQVEPHDVKVLEGCEESIIQPGGFIFLGFHHGKVIASIAFIKLDDRVYEVGKMTVIPEYQGKGIGQRILQYGLSFGQKQGWKLLVIYSCLCLENALHIYKKFGFTEVEL